MKSLKAQLMAAIAMTLVAALTIGSSTYAWFTMNSTVTATGMQMKASSGGNVLIAYSAPGSTSAPEDSAFKVSDTANMTSAAVLAPVSTEALQTWYKTTAGAVTSTTKATDSSYTAVAAPEGTATDNGYYVRQTFYLLAGKDMNVYVGSLSIKKGGTAVPLTNKEIWNSVRLGILAYDGTEGAADSNHIYSLSNAYANGTLTGDGSDATAKGVDAGGSQKVLTNFHKVTGTKAEDKTIGAAKLKANTKTKVDVFIWFEGEDGTCYTNNLNTSDIAVEFTFTDCSTT